jgi:hypothetical protein
MLPLTASLLALALSGSPPEATPAPPESLEPQPLELQPSPGESSGHQASEHPPSHRATAPLGPHDTAATLPAGALTAGVFGPLRWGLADGLELEVHPLLSLVAPAPTLRVRHLSRGPLTVTGEYGLGYPSLLLGLTRGYLFPSGDDQPCGAPCGDRGLPHHLIAEAGAIASLDLAGAGVFSLRTTLRLGLRLTDGALPPLDSLLAPVEALLAPLTRGWHARLGASWDAPLSRTLRARTTLAVHRVGAPPDGFAAASPWLFSWHAALDLATGSAAALTPDASRPRDLRAPPRSRLTLGFMVWSWDAFATTLDRRADGTSVRRRVRSTDVLPTLDYVHAF